MPVVLKWKILDKQATAPRYMSHGASGMDISACLTDHSKYPDGQICLMPGECVAIPTRLAVEIPYGYEMQIRPRSGLALSTKLRIPNSPGTIDSDYRGEIKIIIEHSGWPTDTNIAIKHGDRIAQAVIVPVIFVMSKYVMMLTDTERGEDGFGSTGV